MIPFGFAAARPGEVQRLAGHRAPRGGSDGRRPHWAISARRLSGPWSADGRRPTTTGRGPETLGCMGHRTIAGRILPPEHAAR